MPVSVEDRIAIEDLLYRYATAMEIGDENDLLAVFTEDPTLDSVVHGQATGIEAVIEKSKLSQKNRHLYRLRRMFSNVRIDGGDDHANIIAYFVEFRTPVVPVEDGAYPKSEIHHVGEFECIARKVSGVWLMDRRAVRVDSRLGMGPQ